ncbi:MAG TPA: histidinol-phosphate transaminase [Gemmatimonadaceae bacterium]
MKSRIDDGCFHGGAFFQAVGEGFDDLSRRDGIVNADVLDAWFPPAPGVLASLNEHMSWLARTSPPTTCAGLRAAIARARWLHEPNVLPGSGSSALIYLAMREWLTPRSRVLLLDPCYGEYSHILEKIIGCSVDRLALREADAWLPDLEALARHLAKYYDLFVLVNPNNPTGRIVSRDAIVRLVDKLGERTRVWVDEAYLDYVDPNQSMEQYAARSANVFVCKSLSKVHALSGMRAAYLVGPDAELARLRRLTPPWAVSLPAQVAAVRALENPAYYRRRYRETDALRGSLRKAQSNLPFVRDVSGSANFLLVHLDDGAPDVAAILDGCRHEGVFLRDVSNMGQALGSRVFRTAVKDGNDNLRITSALARALGGPQRIRGSLSPAPGEMTTPSVRIRIG